LPLFESSGTLFLMSKSRQLAAPLRAEVELALRQYFAAAPVSVAAAYLFGSVARESAGRDSDIDVAVLYATAPPATLESVPAVLEVELTRALGRSVQIVVLNRAPVDLVHRVLRDGILVAEHDRSKRIAFEVAARNRYWDLQPILQRYRHPEAAQR
jgi:predicted nucleotidyltransferase